jgi:hypothetical protein
MGFDRPGYENPWVNRYGGPGQFGRGFGYGRGGGRGWRHRYYATGQPGWARGRFDSPLTFDESPQSESFTPRQEKAYLKAQARQHRAALEEIDARLGELSEQKDSEER